MKKLITALLSAALVAAPLAVISTPVVAKTKTQLMQGKKGSTVKGKTSAKASAKTNAKTNAKAKIKNKNKAKSKAKGKSKNAGKLAAKKA